MTKTQDPLKLPAGKELDALVAERVMGWTKQYSIDEVSPYSTDIEAAWAIMERMRQLKTLWLGVMRDRGDTVWTCEMFHLTTHARILSHEATAPLAICRAALKACGVGA